MEWASHKELGEINNFLKANLPAAVVDAFGESSSPINTIGRDFLEVAPQGKSGRFGKNPIHLKLYDYTDSYGKTTDPTKTGIKFTLKSDGNRPVKLEETPEPVKAIANILKLCIGPTPTVPDRILVDNPKSGRVTLKGFNPNEALVFTLDTSPDSETVHGIVELIRQSLDT